MAKVLHKILLLVAVVTVISHSIVPHLHHNELTGEHQELSNIRHHHEHEHESKNNDHEVFSFAQLDDNYVPAKGLSKTFASPVEITTLLHTIVFSANSYLNTKTKFAWYKEYPPPDNPISSLSFRGPPVV